jgi:drug/metabolite transporter (DMT)-like permease
MASTWISCRFTTTTARTAEAVLSDNPRPHLRVYAVLVLVMVFWCGNSIVGRAIRDDIPPFALALSRWSLGLIILVPLAWHKIRDDWAVIRSSWPRILLLGALGIGSFNAFLYSGLRETTATNALLIQAGIPTLVLLFDWLLFRSRPSAMRVAGVVTSAFGVLVIIFRADLTVLLALRFGRGDALIVGSIVVWGLYTALLRLRPPIAQSSFLTLTFLVGLALMLPMAWLESRTTSVHLTPRVVAGIGYVAIFPSVVAYSLFNKAVAELGPPAAGQTISLQPLIGALLAALLLGEALHVYHLLGMVLIVFGIAVPVVFRRSRAVT